MATAWFSVAVRWERQDRPALSWTRGPADALPAVGPSGLRASVEASRRRLRTDYLDLLWVHSSSPVSEVLGGLDDLVALQGEYSLIERTAERQLLPVADLFDLSVCARAPTGAGILTGTSPVALHPLRRQPPGRQPGPPH